MKQEKIAEKVREITSKPTAADAYKLARDERRKVSKRIGQKLGNK